ncbi:MAG: hypothetical protein GY792_18495, partial [Gammaproteobacteria bacterium]|nr:hypothetical protein [Gammaproteobacteria bacterium]
ENQWRFAHDKLRTALLTDLTETERPALHQDVALTIEAVYPDDPVQAANLMNLWHIAGNSNKERRYAFQAGQYATQQFANTEAVAFLTRAYALTPAREQMQCFEILLVREQVYALLGERGPQRQDLNQLTQLADELAVQQVSDHRAVVALRLANYAEVTGEYSTAIFAAQNAIQLA